MNHEEAFKYFKMSSDNGNAEGQLSVGNCYLGGILVSIHVEEAIKYFRMSVDLQNPRTVLAVKQIHEHYKTLQEVDTVYLNGTIKKDNLLTSRGGEYSAFVQANGSFVIYCCYDKISENTIMSSNFNDAYETQTMLALSETGNLEIYIDDAASQRLTVKMRFVMQRWQSSVV